jgi:hypothetical protein
MSMLAFYAMNGILPSDHPWVKHVTDAIADEIDGKHRQQNRQTRKR